MQVCTSLQTNNHASTPPLSFYSPDAFPAALPTASKHWRHSQWSEAKEEQSMVCWCQDLANIGVKKLCVMTDNNVITLPGMKAIVDSLQKCGVDFEVYSNVRVEPTDKRSVCTLWLWISSPPFTSVPLSPSCIFCASEKVVITCSWEMGK